MPPPGKLKEWLRAMKEGKSNVEGWIKPTPEIYDRDARLQKLDEFGVDGAIVYPGEFIATVGYYDQDESGNAVLSAYNRYLAERWGFNVKDRLYTTPVVSLWDLETLGEGSRERHQARRSVVVMPMGPAHGKSPADPYFDPIWSRLNEAGRDRGVSRLGSDLHASADPCLWGEGAAVATHGPDCMAMDVLLQRNPGADDAREPRLQQSVRALSQPRA